MVYFQIIEEEKKKPKKHGNARQAWIKLSRNFYPTTWDSKKRLHQKFAKCEIDDVTTNPEEWITSIELLRGGLQKLDAQTSDSEMMTYIL